MMTETKKLVFVEAPGATLETVLIELINDVPAPKSKLRQTSLIELGQVEPIRLRPTKGCFDIVDGRRRVINAKAAGLLTVTALVEELTDDQATLYSLVQMSRSSNPMMEAKELAKLIAKGQKQEQIAKQLGITQAMVSQRLGLLDLIPELQDKLEVGKMTLTAARAAKKLSPEEQGELAKIDKITVKAAQELLREYQAELIDLSSINIPDLDNTPTPIKVSITSDEVSRLSSGEEIMIMVNGQAIVITTL